MQSPASLTEKGWLPLSSDISSWFDSLWFTVLTKDLALKNLDVAL
jgi:hypothetical protein